MAVNKALSGENPAEELRWAGFLRGPVEVPSKPTKKRVRA
jgi:hypothetical protein